MKTLIAIIILSAATADAQIRIRVTDAQGNVATAKITASNRIARVDEMAEAKLTGTNTAERLAAWFEALALQEAAQHRRATRIAAEDEKFRAAVEQIASEETP